MWLIKHEYASLTLIVSLDQPKSISMMTHGFPVDGRVVHARQSVRMVRPKLGLTNLHYLHEQLLCVLSPDLAPVR